MYTGMSLWALMRPTRFARPLEPSIWLLSCGGAPCEDFVGVVPLTPAFLFARFVGVRFTIAQRRPTTRCQVWTKVSQPIQLTIHCGPHKRAAGVPAKLAPMRAAHMRATHTHMHTTPTPHIIFA